MKTNIHWDGMWWVYTEICDRCGQLSEWECTHVPNVAKADFCANCIMDLLDKDIPYEEAKQIYKK